MDMYTDITDIEKCPGLYCGRRLLENGSLSVCGVCPRGSQPSKNETSLCTMCTAQPEFYDWLYLSFMLLLSLGLHWFFIDYTNKKRTPKLTILYISSTLETLAAGALTVLISEPFGNFQLTSCPVTALSDWYPMFYNPNPNYKGVIHCTQEIVYPLYTIVMYYHALSVLIMMMVRPVLSCRLVNYKGTNSIYAALYFFPMLTVAQAVLGGVIYYTFPFIGLVVSLVTMAAHMSYFEDQAVRSLFLAHFTDARNAAILFCHCLLYAFSIIAITQLEETLYHSMLLLMIPFPFLFYLITAKFTHPYKLELN